MIVANGMQFGIQIVVIAGNVFGGVIAWIMMGLMEILVVVVWIVLEGFVMVVHMMRAMHIMVVVMRRGR